MCCEAENGNGQIIRNWAATSLLRTPLRFGNAQTVGHLEK